MRKFIRVIMLIIKKCIGLIMFLGGLSVGLSEYEKSNTNDAVGLISMIVAVIGLSILIGWRRVSAIASYGDKPAR